MGFFGRLFNSDLRVAQAAEARGRVDLAAEHYGLAGDRAGAVRMHLARADRAIDRAAELAALHDALHWAGEDPTLRTTPAARLGQLMLASARAEGIGTERDRARVRTAAALLVEGGEHGLAGEAYALLGDHSGAAAAYSAGGLIDALETTLARVDDAGERQRAIELHFADYQTFHQVGRRDDARAALAACVQAGGGARYQQLLDQLDGARLTGGRVALRAAGGAATIACGLPLIALGRDVLCEVPLRSAGISRRHAELIVGGTTPFAVRDAGSRNGTRLGGVLLAGTLPLRGAVELGLADDLVLDVEVGEAPDVLVATVRGGLDRGTRLVAAAPGVRCPLDALAPGLSVLFADGRPWLGRDGGAFTLGDQRVAEGRVQLVRGDRVEVDGLRLEVG